MHQTKYSMRGCDFLLGVVVVSHNLFAQGILSSCDMVFGGHKNCTSICLVEGVDAFSKELNSTLNDMFKKYNYVMAFADIKNGTPFNQLLKYKLEHQKENMSIVAGVNLPIMLEMLSQIDTNNPQGLAAYLIDQGRLAIATEEKEISSRVNHDDILG